MRDSSFYRLTCLQVEYVNLWLTSCSETFVSLSLLFNSQLSLNISSPNKNLFWCISVNTVLCSAGEKTRVGTRGQSEIRHKCKNCRSMYMCFGKTVFELFMSVLINKVLLVHIRELKEKLTILGKTRRSQRWWTGAHKATFDFNYFLASCEATEIICIETISRRHF